MSQQHYFPPPFPPIFYTIPHSKQTLNRNIRKYCRYLVIYEYVHARSSRDISSENVIKTPFFKGLDQVYNQLTYFNLILYPL